MKKSLLALAVLGAFAGAAQAQSSVTIYGIVDTGLVYSNNVATSLTDNGSKFQMKSGVLQGSRLGFKGVEDLGGGLNAIFQLEAGFNNNDGTNSVNGNLFNRKSVVGLSGSFGTVTLGRQVDVLDDIGGLTSIADFGGVVNNTGSGLARTQGSRSNNSIRYNTANLNGFTGSLYYALGGEAGSNSKGQAFGLGGLYQNGPLSLGAGYYQSKASTTAGTGDAVTSYPAVKAGETQVKTFTLAAAYQLGAAKLYGNWSRIKQPGAVGWDGVKPLIDASKLTANYFVIGGANNDKIDLFEIGGNYALSPALKLLASVQYSKLNYVDVGVSSGKLTQYNLGADYALSKRTDAYAFLSNLRATDTINPGVIGGQTGGSQTGGSQTALAVGVRHKF